LTGDSKLKAAMNDNDNEVKLIKGGTTAEFMGLISATTV
jgi:hypothetical protein